MPTYPSSNKTDQILALLKHASKKWTATTLAQVKEETNDPFKILISTVLSARTKDETTLQASKRLFQLAASPEKMIMLSRKSIERVIYPVGFYRTKAKNILSLCQTLLQKFEGKVPDTLEELLSLKGVGRKTANLVITLAFRKYGICVDTHVHRISNRWGLVKTKNPKETEFALYKVLSKKYWISYNNLLVSFGQNVCKPISPLCSGCPVGTLCPKVGVKKHR